MESRRGAPPSYLALDEDHPSTASWRAIVRSSLSNFALLRRLRHENDVNASTFVGIRALHLAAMHGEMKQLKHLLEDGADASLENSSGQTAIDLARLYKQTEAANYLAVHEALVKELADHLERTPTMDDVYVAMNFVEFRGLREHVKSRVLVQGVRFVEAARRGDLQLVREMLVTEAVDVNAFLPSTSETALSAALGSGRFVLCSFLLSCGAHANAPCVISGRTQSAMFTAVQKGSVDLVERLAQAGAHLGLRRQGLDTCPLLEAVKCGFYDIVDVLLRLEAPLYGPRGLGVSLPDFGGLKPFLWRVSVPLGVLCLASWLQNRELVEHLLESQPALKDRATMTLNLSHALFLAVYRQNLALVTMLLDKGASANHGVFSKESALTAALAVDSVDMLRFLVKRGGDIHALYDTNTNRDSLLCRSIRCGAVSCTRFLLPLETRPTLRDKALEAAAICGDVEVAHHLLDKSLPSTERAFVSCVEGTRSPLLLDLLLSRCCAERYPVSLLSSSFESACSHHHSRELLEIFVAHGLDIMSDLAQSCSSYAMSPVIAERLFDTDRNSHVLQFLHDCGLSTVKIKQAQGVCTQNPPGKAGVARCIIDASVALEY